MQKVPAGEQLPAARLLIAAYAINGGPGGGRPKAVDLSFMALALLYIQGILQKLSLTRQ
jgi:hypothetical protein